MGEAKVVAQNGRSDLGPEQLMAARKMELSWETNEDRSTDPVARGETQVENRLQVQDRLQSPDQSETKV
jgi:hypothetical protein